MIKSFLKAIALTFFVFLTGCIGLGDLMKIPPSSLVMWKKSGMSDIDVANDLSNCDLNARLSKIQGGRPSVHFVEACMLEKGYTFTNYRSHDTADYCNKDWWGGGPACRSIGR